MKLIVGLGNPGILYIGSRHNIGFSVVKALALKYKASFKRKASLSSLITKIKVDEDPVLLALPLTFMNLSGIAVKQLLREYKIPPANLFVICDDLDLEFGRLKVRAAGSSGGHRGLESIVGALASEDFARLRIGIDRPSGRDPSEYVLAAFSRKEKIQLKSVLEKARECCLSWVTRGTTHTMNIFNKSALVSSGTSRRSILSERSESKE